MPYNHIKEPRSSKTIPIHLSFDLTIQLVEKAVRASRFSVVNINRQTGTILAKKNMSFKSWGEHILINVVAKGNGCVVQVVSESSVSATKVDWGANAANIERFERELKQFESEFLRQYPEMPVGLPEWASDSSQKEQPGDQPTPETDHQSPYEILGILPGATRQEITEAYRNRIKLYHPDKVAGLAPEFRELAEERSKGINAAYDELMKMDENP